MSGFDNRICVAWGSIAEVQKGKLNFLVYGDGKVRTYASDNIDSRVEGTPFASSLSEWVKFIRENPGKPCQIRVGLAKQVTEMSDNEFDYQ